jgi:hypothetical protein
VQHVSEAGDAVGAQPNGTLRRPAFSVRLRDWPEGSNRAGWHPAGVTAGERNPLARPGRHASRPSRGRAQGPHVWKPLNDQGRYDQIAAELSPNRCISDDMHRISILARHGDCGKRWTAQSQCAHDQSRRVDVGFFRSASAQFVISRIETSEWHRPRCYAGQTRRPSASSRHTATAPPVPQSSESSAPNWSRLSRPREDGDASTVPHGRSWCEDPQIIRSRIRMSKPCILLMRESLAPVSTQRFPPSRLRS